MNIANEKYDLENYIYRLMQWL